MSKVKRENMRTYRHQKFTEFVPNAFLSTMDNDFFVSQVTIKIKSLQIKSQF